MEIDEQVVEKEEPEEISLEDTIREAMRAPAMPDPVAETAPAKPDVARDETGKFAPKPAEPKPRETLTLPEKDAGIRVDPSQQLGVQPPKPLPDWMGWKGEARSKFNELPDWARAEVLRREEEAHKAISRNDDERSFAARSTKSFRHICPRSVLKVARQRKPSRAFYRPHMFCAPGRLTRKQWPCTPLHNSLMWIWDYLSSRGRRIRSSLKWSVRLRT